MYTINSSSLVFYSQWDLEMWPLCLSEPGVWGGWAGPILWVETLKLQTLHVQFKPFTLHGEAGNWGSLLTLCCCVRVELRVCLSLSYRFQCGCLLSSLMYKSHSASFWISFRRNCALCNCTFSMPVRKRKLRNPMTPSSSESFTQTFSELLECREM